MRDSIEEFKNAIRCSGMEPPDTIEPGKFYRFPGIGKQKGNTAGWCKLFEDGLGGSFGDFASLDSQAWQAKRNKPFAKADWEAINLKRSESEVKAKKLRSKAKKEAECKWGAGISVSAEHPYLFHKEVKAYGIRQNSQGQLIVPVRDGTELHSLQFIGENGEKYFLPGGKIKGCYHSVGEWEQASVICIAEGYATAATVYEATGYPVIVAFNAGNLFPVSQTMRKVFPKSCLAICVDDDLTVGNPGLTRAKEAAQAFGGVLAIPEFVGHRSKKITDFNDMAKLTGLDSVRVRVQGAVSERA